MKKIKVAFLVIVCVLFASSIALGQRVVNPADNEKAADKKVLKRYEVQLNTSIEKLSNNFGTWKSASLYVQRAFDSKQIVWGQYRLSDRNSNRDQEFMLGTYKPLNKKWAITAEAMYSPTQKYVGRFSAMGEVERIFRKGWVGHAGFRHTSYTTVKANTGYGLVEKYWGNNRASYTLYLTSLSNAGTAPSQRISYNRYYGERVNNFGIAASFGREHENLGPSIGILRSNTWSISTSAKYWITKRLGIDASALYHQQGKIYNRKGFNFGIRYKF